MSSNTALATFGGMASGLPVQQLIDATINANSTRLKKYQEDKDMASKQQSAYSSIKAKVTSLDSCLQTVVDSRMIYAFDLFDRKTSTVSDNSVATVSTSKGASTGNVELIVNSLATPPQVTLNNIGKPITSNVNLYDLGVIDESFSLAFVTPTGGVTITASVVSGDTLASYVAKLNADIAESGVLSGSITVGVDANGAAKIDFSGVTGGTLNATNPFPNSQSNFADVFGLKVTANTLAGIPKSIANLDGKFSENASGLLGMDNLTLPETINIGGVNVEITASSTLRQIMNKVNENSKSQVTMTYDTTTNNLTFKGKDNFYSDNLYFSGKAFLSNLGLTDSNGVVNTSVQTQRTPGEILINGKKISIRSNKVTAAETGLTGVNITLKSKSDPEEPVKIGISDNTDDLTKALDNVVGAFNALAKTISDYTYVKIDTTDEKAEAEKGVLANEYAVTSMKTSIQMRLMTPSTQEGLTYNALAVVGFSTKDGSLAIDKTKFLNALADNPEDIKKLLVGSKEDNTTGIFQSVQDLIDQYTDVVGGFFATKTSSITTSIKNLNTSIASEEDRLEQERTRLVKQYSNLDSIVSKYQSQMSAFSQ